MKEYSNSLFRKEIDRLHMDISETVRSSLDADWKYRSKHPTFTRIYAIIKGEGVIYSCGEEIPMTAGNIYILPTGTGFSYKCNTAMEKLYFHINMLQYDGTDIFTLMKTPAVIYDKAALIGEMSECFDRNDIFGALSIKARLMNLVVEGFVATQTELGSITEYSPVVKQAVQYVENHLRACLTVNEISQHLYISESRLQKAFKQEIGIPLGQYISDRLFFVAEKSLRTSNRSIKQISNELGFCDPFYFSRCFTKRYGTPPSKYRAGSTHVQ